MFHKTRLLQKTEQKPVRPYAPFSPPVLYTAGENSASSLVHLFIYSFIYLEGKSGRASPESNLTKAFGVS